MVDVGVTIDSAVFLVESAVARAFRRRVSAELDTLRER
jgi:hypothetical protein